eukprot:3518743-Pleurochrysis_carterae.AAC.2
MAIPPSPTRAAGGIGHQYVSVLRKSVVSYGACMRLAILRKAVLVAFSVLRISTKLTASFLKPLAVCGLGMLWPAAASSPKLIVIRRLKRLLSTSTNAQRFNVGSEIVRRLYAASESARACVASCGSFQATCDVVHVQHTPMSVVGVPDMLTRQAAPGGGGRRLLPLGGTDSQTGEATTAFSCVSAARSGAARVRRAPQHRARGAGPVTSAHMMHTLQINVWFQMHDTVFVSDSYYLSLTSALLRSPPVPNYLITAHQLAAMLLPLAVVAMM